MELLTCQICSEGGFLNLAGHIYNRHNLNGEEYRSQTGYGGPLVVPEHASRIASMTEWTEESRKRLSESISASYTDELKQKRSEDASVQWESNRDRMMEAIQNPVAQARRLAAAREVAASRITSPYSLLRQKLYDRSGGLCEWCGKAESVELEERGKRLSLHHLNYDKLVPEPEDVVLICGHCHHTFHGDGRQRERFPMVSKVVGDLLRALGVSLSDPNFQETPRRVANYLLEKFPSVTTQELIMEEFKDTVFPSDYRGMVISRDTRASGLCPHHLLPVLYEIHLAYIPTGHVCGLSKLSRMAEIFASQALLQEDVAERIADTMEFCLSTPHVAVYLRGKHMCMCVRGVKLPDSSTITSSMRGHFKTNDRACKDEFFTLLGLK